MSPKIYLNERLVVDIEIDGIDLSDYPDFCDAFANSARYDDTGTALTEDELDQIRDDPDFHQLIFNHVF